ncbi:BlaI/MecI/CopY family transcriptional regulator [Propioniciclava coleopterorum]|uniref:BlaI/MecI/CopY family transcriptional regulator n=1 Tax=Propioniciclava coleopterorum TaxID=2714937 RepID=A0A6G7Y3N3_9ACTN|nr:BlaI/MecI/CopY family transcriptional regulator [Propioniciclava coleopterorum]QIK71258.1 BlaI/MecI/CopY family transcriptional regulator [Propioniciclava coleopterorum]
MRGAPEHPGEPLRLGALEAQVMGVLWDHGPATVREVIERLPTDPAYTTIATVLTNLDRKHLLSITRQNHSTRYSARIGRHEHAAALMEQVLEASRDRSASILQFVDSMPDSDLDLLRDYLKRRDAGERP